MGRFVDLAKLIPAAAEPERDIAELDSLIRALAHSHKWTEEERAEVMATGRADLANALESLRLLVNELPPVEEAPAAQPEPAAETGEQIRQREAEAVATMRTATFVRLFKERRFEERSTVRRDSFKLWRFR